MTFSISTAIPTPCAASREQAIERQSQLTKPLHSLGTLEEVAADFAAWQGQAIPKLDKIALRVFAADHGITAQNISAFPQEVTTQMIRNFCSGGAAVSVLSSQQGFDFEVWNLGTVQPVETLPVLKTIQIAPGTQDFSQQAAMSGEHLEAALAAGAAAVPENTQLFIGGEMGIGNTTSAAALIAAYYGFSAEEVTGRGTGLDDPGLAHKTSIVAMSLELHMADKPNPLELLKRLGGFEIAALVGAYLGAAQRGIPSLIDGFITSVAAAYAIALNPAARDWMIFAHCSAELAHKKLLDLLQAKPLLELEMRLGEASGAAVAVPVIKSALALHADMATFADAQVSENTTT